MDIAERLARDVIAPVEGRPDEHLCALALRIAPGVPADAFQRAFEAALADGGVELVDISVCAGPECGIGSVQFDRS